MKKYVLKSILIFTSIFALTACGGSGKSSKEKESLNYSSFNYDSLNYSFSESSFSMRPYFQALDFSANLLTENDPSSFLDISYSGQYDNLIPDSREISDTLVDAFVFVASYENQSIYVYVNPEFGAYEEAVTQANNYAEVIGRIPTFLRNGIKEVYIHKGYEPLAGAGNYLLIYSDLGESLNTKGILEEVIIREAVHVSLDSDIGGSDDWLRAQIDDGAAISQIAKNLENEDLAESFLAYLAVRYRSNRISGAVRSTVLYTIPNRLDYLDFLGFTMYPIVQDTSANWDESAESLPINYDSSLFTYYRQWEKNVSL